LIPFRRRGHRRVKCGGNTPQNKAPRTSRYLLYPRCLGMGRRVLTGREAESPFPTMSTGVRVVFVILLGLYIFRPLEWLPVLLIIRGRGGV
jgi:hypothetical protein